MANNNYDVVVVGAGHNGLTAAAYMAKAGLSTVVVEAMDHVGGDLSSAEVTVPGFMHDVAGTCVFMSAGHPIIADDELELKAKYGLELCYQTAPSTIEVFDDRTTMAHWHEIDRCADEIAEFSQHDAEMFPKFIEYIMPLGQMVKHGTSGSAPQVGSFFMQMDQTPIGREFLRNMFLSCGQVAEEWFEHDKTKIRVMNVPTEAMVDPDAGGSAFYLMTVMPNLHDPNMIGSFPKGGVQQISESLVRCIKDHGGEVLLNHEVTRINTQGGRAVSVTCANGETIFANKAVVTNVDPSLSLLKWLDTPVSDDLKRKINGMLEPDFSGLMTHVALDEEPTFDFGTEAMQTATLIELLPSSLEDFRGYFYDLRKKRLPEKPRRLLNVFPHRVDPSRCPEGKAVWYDWQYMPYNLADGGPQKWDEVKEEMSNRSMNHFMSYTNNITPDKVLGRKIISPIDYERWNPNNVNGRILGPAPHMVQNMAWRPVPELGGYGSPIEGLYGCGQSYHPSGGITFGGRGAAQVILDELGYDFDDVI